MGWKMRAGGIPRWLSGSLLLLLLVGSYAEIPETEVGTPEQAEVPKAEVGGGAPVGTSPQELYEYGMKLAGSDRAQEALGYLRSAVRKEPSSAKFLNDLGVAEMRLGQLHSARKRFLKALQADASYKVASENLLELETYLQAERHENRKMWDPARRQLHALQPLPRLSVADLSWPWNAHYANLQSPFILTGAMGQWKTHRLTLDALANKYPQALVDFYPQGMSQVDATPLFRPLAAAAAHLRDFDGVWQGMDASEPGAYVQWNLPYATWKNLSRSMDLPEVFRDPFDWIQACFPRDEDKDDFFLKTHWSMALMGEKGSGMFNHQDTIRTASWQAQVSGTKRWHLCGPDQSPFLYSAGDVDLMGPPNYRKHRAVRKAACFQDDVSAGEMVFYPHDWWHQTKSTVGPSVAVSGSLVTFDNFRLVFEELRRECDGEAARLFISAQGTCEGIQRCGEVWEGWVREHGDTRVMGQGGSREEEEEDEDDEEEEEEMRQEIQEVEGAREEEEKEGKKEEIVEERQAHEDMGRTAQMDMMGERQLEVGMGAAGAEEEKAVEPEPVEQGVVAGEQKRDPIDDKVAPIEDKAVGTETPLVNEDKAVEAMPVEALVEEAIVADEQKTIPIEDKAVEAVVEEAVVAKEEIADGKEEGGLLEEGAEKDGPVTVDGTQDDATPTNVEAQAVADSEGAVTASDEQKGGEKGGEQEVVEVGREAGEGPEVEAEGAPASEAIQEDGAEEGEGEGLVGTVVRVSENVTAGAGGGKEVGAVGVGQLVEGEGLTGVKLGESESLLEAGL